MDILAEIESAIAEVPENVGKALSFMGEKLQELAARLDKLEKKSEAPPAP